MENQLIELFDDEVIKETIRNKLPKLFRIAELESSRAGKIGMEVGSMREKILVALLIYKFGERNVETEIPITEAEVDVKLFNQTISIKTITGDGRVKLVWTVDRMSVLRFVETYEPHCDMLLAQIKWDLSNEKLTKGIHPGGLFLIPTDVQQRVFNEIGREHYLTTPKEGTNPRGVEFSKDGLTRLLEDRDTKCIEIIWRRSEFIYDPYKRWVDLWRES